MLEFEEVFEKFEFVDVVIVVVMASQMLVEKVVGEVLVEILFF